MQKIDSLKHILSKSWQFFFDGQIPFLYKCIPLAALLYIITPVDVIPEIAFPIVGYIDDATLMLIALTVFHHLSQKYLGNDLKTRDTKSIEEAEIANKKG